MGWAHRHEPRPERSVGAEGGELVPAGHAQVADALDLKRQYEPVRPLSAGLGVRWTTNLAACR